MLTVMDMSTGKIIKEEGQEPEFGRFEDEVLNAEYLPGVELQLGLQPVVHHDVPPSEDDAEGFLAKVYRSQE
jgi:hypothetical protein